MKNALANLGCADGIRPLRVKRAGFVFCFLSTLLLLCLLISPAAAEVEWKISPSNPSLGDTLKIKGTAAPWESIRAEVAFEKNILVSRGRYRYSLNDMKVPAGNDNRFTVEADGVKNLHVGVKKLVWFHLNSEASEGVARVSKEYVPPFTCKVLIDGDALEGRSFVQLTVTASQTLKADSKGKFEFKYDTSSMPAGMYTIRMGSSEKTVDLLPKGQKK